MSYNQFDKKKFAELLYKAVGQQGINPYGRLVHVSGSYISRYLRCLVKNPPSPEIIAKLTKFSQNGITYDQLMEAAGYIKKTPDLEQVSSMIEEDINSKKASKLSDILPSYAADELKNLGFDLAALIKEKEITKEEIEKLLLIIRTLK